MTGLECGFGSATTGINVSYSFNLLSNVFIVVGGVDVAVETGYHHVTSFIALFFVRNKILRKRQLENYMRN